MRLARILATAKPAWWLYALVDQDRVPVYIGMSKRPESRARWHCTSETPTNRALTAWARGKQPRSVFELLDSFPTKRMALDAELEYIAYLQPSFNTIGRFEQSF